MRALRRLYIACLLACIFTACEKKDVDDSKDYQALGTSAHDLLSAVPYSSLTVEIQYMPGYAPDNASVDSLKGFLYRFINKPAGIKVIEEQVPASNKSVLSLQDVVDIEKKYRTIFSGNSIMAVHILVTDAPYDSAAIFGTSYWNTSFCIFGKTVSDNSGDPGQVTRSQLFTVLFEHEFGHLMGLVNQGSPMKTNHQDVANGAHCSNQNCLMYFSIETTTILETATLPSLDSNCINDLVANGGK